MPSFKAPTKFMVPSSRVAGPIMTCSRWALWPTFMRVPRGKPAELVAMPQYQGNKARVENVQVLDRLIGEWTIGHDIAELEAMLKAADIPSSKVFTAQDCAEDPQYLDRGMVREVEDPAFDAPVLHAGVVPHVAENPGVIRWPGPAIGAHNQEVLGGLLGMSAEQIAGLQSQGVI